MKLGVKRCQVYVSCSGVVAVAVILKGVNEFLPYFSYFLTSLGKIQRRRNHVMLLSGYKYNKIWCNEISKSINEILLVVSIFDDQFG